MRAAAPEPPGVRALRVFLAAKAGPLTGSPSEMLTQLTESPPDRMAASSVNSVSTSRDLPPNPVSPSSHCLPHIVNSVSDSQTLADEEEVPWDLRREGIGLIHLDSKAHGHVLIVRDGDVIVPPDLAGLVRFTWREVGALLEEPDFLSAAVRAKRSFPGASLEGVRPDLRLKHRNRGTLKS